MSLSSLKFALFGNKYQTQKSNVDLIIYQLRKLNLLKKKMEQQ